MFYLHLCATDVGRIRGQRDHKIAKHILVVKPRDQFDRIWPNVSSVLLHSGEKCKRLRGQAWIKPFQREKIDYNVQFGCTPADTLHSPQEMEAVTSLTSK